MEIKINININDLVEVKLTPTGFNILEKHHPSELIYNYDKVTGIYITELWELMAIFGKYQWMGNPFQYFENNMLIFTKD